MLVQTSRKWAVSHYPTLLPHWAAVNQLSSPQSLMISISQSGLRVYICTGDAGVGVCTECTVYSGECTVCPGLSLYWSGWWGGCAWSTLHDGFILTSHELISHLILSNSYPTPAVTPHSPLLVRLSKLKSILNPYLGLFWYAQFSLYRVQIRIHWSRSVNG